MLWGGYVATKTFRGNSVEECLKEASNDLNISIEKIKYKIVEEKKGFLKKKVIISVNLNEQISSDNGTIQIIDGKINVKNPKNQGKPAIIRPSKEINLIIDGEKVDLATEVYDYSKIEVEFDKNVAERVMKISLSPDNMKAYIDIKYIPEVVYKLKDCVESNEVNLSAEIKDKKWPPRFSKEEIIEELNKNNVVQGIAEDVVEMCSNKEKVDHMLIAEGIQAIDDIDDELEIKFDNDTNELVEDNTGRVDFKSIGHITSVKKGDILAVLRKGKPGKDGVDVTGKTIKHKKGNVIHLKAGEGCEVKNETR